jgi:hypothetical protein
LAALVPAVLDVELPDPVCFSPAASAAPSTAPLAAPEAAPLRTLPTASFTLVKIPFDERDLPDLPDFFELLACAFPALFFAPDWEADFFAAFAAVFFLVVFLVAIVILP